MTSKDVNYQEQRRADVVKCNEHFDRLLNQVAPEITPDIEEDRAENLALWHAHYDRLEANAERYSGMSDDERRAAKIADLEAKIRATDTLQPAA